MTDREEKSAEQPNSEKEKLRLGEMMREFAVSGLATYFMTEDAVKTYIKDLKLPKELAGIVLEGIGKKKDDFYGLMVKEFGKVLSKVDVSAEISKFLEKHNVQIEAKVSFEPKEGK